MKTLLFGLTLVGGLGCMTAQPVGPMAKAMKPAKGPAAAEKDAPAAAEVAPAPAGRPTPPALLITEAEVGPENTAAAARKLMTEFEFDRKSAAPPSRTAEVSVYKGGMKQN